MLVPRFMLHGRQALRTVSKRSNPQAAFRSTCRPESLVSTWRSVRYYVVEQRQWEKSNPGPHMKDQEAKEDVLRDQGPAGGKESNRSATSWTDSPYTLALLILGTSFVAYGVYGLYVVMTLWPQEVRSDLRSGLRAKRKGDSEAALAYLSRAWQTAKSLPLDKFGEDPLLKVTGIGIALGGLFEDSKRLQDAYAIYEDTFWFLRTSYLDIPPSSIKNRPDLGVETLKNFTSADRMRAVALSYKLAEVAHDLGRPPQEEERWLVWAVEAILRTVLDAPPMAAVEVVRPVGPGQWAAAEGPNVKVLVEQLGLPEWTMRHDIAAPFEALGTFYGKSGNLTFALPLYLQAISILLPPTPNVAPVEDKCRAAQLMGNVAELMIRSMNTKTANPEALSQAETWAKKGLDIVTATREISPIKCNICEESLAMLLYNVAMIRDLSGDKVQARALLSEALEQFKAIGMEEGTMHSQEALRALGEFEEVKSNTIETQGQQELK